MDTHEKIEGTLYRVEPGDMTRYTFAILPLGEKHTNIISGISINPDQYIMLGIEMTKTGFGVLPIWDLLEIQKDPKYLDYIYGYARSHGFGDVDPYTLRIVLAMTGYILDGKEPDEAGKMALSLIK